MPDLTKEESNALDEYWTKDTPKIDAGKSCFVRRRLEAYVVEGDKFSCAESFAFGAESLAFGAESFAAGAESFAAGAESLAFGAESFAAGAGSLAAGAGSFAAGAESLAAGAESFAAGAGSLAFGAESLASGNKSFIFQFPLSRLEKIYRYRRLKCLIMYLQGTQHLACSSRT